MPPETTPATAPRPGDQRPGGRTARVRRAVFDAVLGLMQDEGHLALTMDAVAARAGVHKTTLYRRYGSVDVLVREALEDYQVVSIRERPVPDTGSFGGDMRALALVFGEYLARPMTVAVLRMLIAESPKNPELAAWSVDFLPIASRPFEVVIERAVSRGELPDTTTPADLAEPLVGPMVMRALVTGFPLDDEFLEKQAALVFRGLRTREEDG